MTKVKKGHEQRTTMERAWRVADTLQQAGKTKSNWKTVLRQIQGHPLLYPVAVSQGGGSYGIRILVGT